MKATRTPLIGLLVAFALLLAPVRGDAARAKKAAAGKVYKTGRTPSEAAKLGHQTRKANMEAKANANADTFMRSPKGKSETKGMTKKQLGERRALFVKRSIAGQKGAIKAKARATKMANQGAAGKSSQPKKVQARKTNKNAMKKMRNKQKKLARRLKKLEQQMAAAAGGEAGAEAEEMLDEADDMGAEEIDLDEVDAELDDGEAEGEELLNSAEAKLAADDLEGAFEDHILGDATSAYSLLNAADAYDAAGMDSDAMERLYKAARHYRRAKAMREQAWAMGMNPSVDGLDELADELDDVELPEDSMGVEGDGMEGDGMDDGEVEEDFENEGRVSVAGMPGIVGPVAEPVAAEKPRGWARLRAALPGGGRSPRAQPEGDE